MAPDPHQPPPLADTVRVPLDALVVLIDHADDHSKYSGKAWRARTQLMSAILSRALPKQFDGSEHQPGCRAEDSFPCHCLTHNDGDDRG